MTKYLDNWSWSMKMSMICINTHLNNSNSNRVHRVCHNKACSHLHKAVSSNSRMNNNTIQTAVDSKCNRLDNRNPKISVDKSRNKAVIRDAVKDRMRVLRWAVQVWDKDKDKDKDKDSNKVIIRLW